MKSNPVKATCYKTFFQSFQAGKLLVLKKEFVSRTDSGQIKNRFAKKEVRLIWITLPQPNIQMNFKADWVILNKITIV